MKKVLSVLLALTVAVGLFIPFSGTVMAAPDATPDKTVPVRVKALVIRAPDVVEVGEQVHIKVTEKFPPRPVAGAKVWALRLPLEPQTINVEPDYAELARTRGQFLGETDNGGNLFHTFNEPGRRLLVTRKEGYVPGFKKMAVKSHGRLEVKAPDSAWVAELVTVKVTEDDRNAPVEGAKIYAMGINIVTATAARADNFAEIAPSRGSLIGISDKNGKVEHRFSRPGRYVLVAVKDDYLRGYAKILIKPPVTAVPKRLPTTTAAQ